MNHKYTSITYYAIINEMPVSSIATVWLQLATPISHTH